MLRRLSLMFGVAVGALSSSGCELTSVHCFETGTEGSGGTVRCEFDREVAGGSAILNGFEAESFDDGGWRSASFIPIPTHYNASAQWLGFFPSGTRTLVLVDGFGEPTFTWDSSSPDEAPTVVACDFADCVIDFEFAQPDGPAPPPEADPALCGIVGCSTPADGS